MTHKQIEAFEMFKFIINNCNDTVAIDRETAINIKQIIENQAEYTKELLEQIDSLKEDHDLMVEQILDKVRYLCGMKDRDNNQVYVITKDELNNLERRLKGEE